MPLEDTRQGRNLGNAVLLPVQASDFIAIRGYLRTEDFRPAKVALIILDAAIGY